MKRATITIDGIAGEFFPEGADTPRTYQAILADVLSHLQDKGDDPRYPLVIFSDRSNPKFVGVDSRHGVLQTGVFTRVSGTRFERDYDVVRSLFKGRESLDLLIVAKDTPTAEYWQRIMPDFGYTLREI